MLPTQKVSIISISAFMVFLLQYSTVAAVFGPLNLNNPIILLFSLFFFAATIPQTNYRIKPVNRSSPGVPHSSISFSPYPRIYLRTYKCNWNKSHLHSFNFVSYYSQFFSSYMRAQINRIGNDVVFGIEIHPTRPRAAAPHVHTHAHARSYLACTLGQSRFG